MLWFLRLFRSYRDLEAQRTVAAAKIVSLAGESVSLREQLREMTERFAQAQRSEIEATRRMVDSFARRHGAPVFDVAGEIPLRPDEFEPIPRQKVQASVLVEQMEGEFREALEQMDRDYEKSRTNR